MGASGEDFVVTSKHSFRAASEMHFLCHEIGVAKHWNGTGVAWTGYKERT
jgi:hypothetical protein